MDLVLILSGVAAVHVLSVMSPGPSLLVVAQTSVAVSRRAGTWTAVGLGLGSLIWALAALFGLQALFAVAPWLYLGLKLAGAAYLLYLAVTLWRHARDPLPVAAGRPAHGGALRRGLLTQLANPKVAVFFGSIFVTLVPPQPSPLFYALILPMIFVVEFAWYAFVAHFLSIERLRDRYARLKAIIDRVTGTFLAALGVKLALDR